MLVERSDFLRQTLTRRNTRLGFGGHPGTRLEVHTLDWSAAPQAAQMSRRLTPRARAKTARAVDFCLARVVGGPRDGRQGRRRCRSGGFARGERVGHLRQVCSSAMRLWIYFRRARATSALVLHAIGHERRSSPPPPLTFPPLAASSRLDLPTRFHSAPWIATTACMLLTHLHQSIT
eukprot:363526-Chlamydomonas_euryale.AAC.3